MEDEKQLQQLQHLSSIVPLEILLEIVSDAIKNFDPKNAQKADYLSFLCMVLMIKLSEEKESQSGKVETVKKETPKPENREDPDMDDFFNFLKDFLN